MAEFTQTDWYRYPHYYDIVFDNDTRREADFLEAVLHRHGPAPGNGRSARILEPACGTGRLVLELARRGHQVTGFDTSDAMTAYAAARLAGLPAAVRWRVRLRKASMESFRMRGPFDLAHCLLSTFKYLLTEDDAVAHLKRVARVLAPGGVYVLGLHLTNYTRRKSDQEVWRGERDGVRVTSEVITRPADPVTRLESLRNRLRVRQRGVRATQCLETHWRCRTYDSAELQAVFARVPVLEPVACYDFSHDINLPRALDDSQEDLVVVLRN